jgi:hypothetical protein
LAFYFLFPVLLHRSALFKFYNSLFEIILKHLSTRHVTCLKIIMSNKSAINKYETYLVFGHNYRYTDDKICPSTKLNIVIDHKTIHTIVLKVELGYILAWCKFKTNGIKYEARTITTAENTGSHFTDLDRMEARAKLACPRH